MTEEYTQTIKDILWEKYPNHKLDFSLLFEPKKDVFTIFIDFDSVHLVDEIPVSTIKGYSPHTKVDFSDLALVKIVNKIDEYLKTSLSN